MEVYTDCSVEDVVQATGCQFKVGEKLGKFGDHAAGKGSLFAFSTSFII